MNCWKLTVLLASWLAAGFAQGALDGKATYEAFCGACHGADGKGASDGQFPPLAKSPWVEGKADRMTQAVLHGLHGPLSLAMPDGRVLNYDLEMPPQGGALSDVQLAAVLTYVRSAWGNQQSAVSADEVKAQREVSKNRTKMWTAEELLKKYPLPEDEVLKKMARIENLLSYGYEGKFTSLADLRAAKAENVEEEHAGLLSLKNHIGKDDFGLVWEGELVVPVDGEYEFFLDSDDGSAVTLGGREILTLDRVGAIKKPITTKVILKKGTVPVKIEYFEYRGEEHIVFGWKAKGKKTVWLQEEKIKTAPVLPSIPIVAPEGEAVVYRNFIEGVSPRAIGVGYSEGVNLAMSADSVSLDLLWIGKFMDGGRHWTNRGQGNAAPAGTGLVAVNQGPAFAILESAKSAWPDTYDEKLAPVFKGYQFDENRHPAFFYRLGKMKVRDHCAPLTGEVGFARTLDFESDETIPENLYFSLYEGKEIVAAENGAFFVGDTLMISAPGESIIQLDDRLFLPLNEKAKKKTINIFYRWK